MQPFWFLPQPLFIGPLRKSKTKLLGFIIFKTNHRTFFANIHSREILTAGPQKGAPAIFKGSFN